MSQCKHVTASSTSSICWEGNWRSVQAQSWLRRRLPLRCLQQIRPFGRRSRPQKFMLRTKTTLALSASARTVTTTPTTVICVPSRCSENQGSPSENHRVGWLLVALLLTRAEVDRLCPELLQSKAVPRTYARRASWRDLRMAESGICVPFFLSFYPQK